MTAPQAWTKIIVPRILAKLVRPKNSPTQDQFIGNVASTTVNNGRKNQICQCSCAEMSTIIDRMANSMQTAISLVLFIRSASQPRKIGRGSCRERDEV